MKALLFTTVALEIVFIGFYIYLPKIRNGMKSLPVKTVCAITFVLIGIIAAFASGGYGTSYAVLMSVGAAFGAIGDYTLDMNPKSRGFYVGLGSFLIGHIFYTAGFAKVLIGNLAMHLPKILLPALAVIVLTLIIVAAGKKLKVNPGNAVVPVMLYVLAISTMLVFAATASVEAVRLNGPGALPAAVIIFLGAALFVASDAVLAIKAFSKRKVKIQRAANPLTYFPAQTLLALSIYFVQSLLVR